VNGPQTANRFNAFSMKHSLLFLVLFLASFRVLAGNVEFTYHFDSPDVQILGNYQALQFGNTYLTGKTGEPALPYAAVKLLLPPGEEAMTVTYNFEEETALEGTFLLYPQQPSRPISAGGDGSFHQNSLVYSSANAYPQTAWGEYSTHYLNGHSFLLSSFTPVRYVPATGSITYYRTVRVMVTTRPTERSARAYVNLSTSQGASARIENLAQNREMMESYPARAARDEGYQVLIVTPQQFQATFQQLHDLYLVRGLKSETATTEYIASSVSGQDLQEKIRNYILQEYQDNGIEYVILGGDDEYVPHRGFYCYVISGGGYEDSDIPADVYYSALDGNWNTDGDWYWGEIGEDDLLPDVAVARYPVSTVSQLEKMILKATRYQNQPVTGELRNPLMAGEELWSNPLTYGEDYIELLIGHHEDNGYTTDGIPEDFTFHKLYDHLTYWGGSDLINAVNQGRSFIHHSGHANQTYVMRLDISQVNNNTFSQANGVNHNYTLVYTHGCLCGAFDENDCIGEAMVLIDNFAVAGAFNSRYGWFNEGQTEGPSAHLHREFVDALYHDKECHIGAAHMISKIESSTWVNAPGQWEEGALRWCFYCCNILGDPVLGVWTDEPMDIETEYPEEILPGATTVAVTVTSSGQPVEGACCSITSDGELLGCAETDAAGYALINVPASFAGITEADLSVSGYNCLLHQYPLSIQVGTGEMPASFASISNKPNPFSDVTTLVLSLDKPSDLSVSYYLPSGQLLSTQPFRASAGINEIRPDVTGWPEGVILVRIISNGTIHHHQMVRIGK
jgi:hypothetical protein